MTGIVSRGGSIMAKWCMRIIRRTSLPHFREIARDARYESRSRWAEGRARLDRRRQRRVAVRGVKTHGEAQSVAGNRVQVENEGPAMCP